MGKNTDEKIYDKFLDYCGMQRFGYIYKYIKDKKYNKVIAIISLICAAIVYLTEASQYLQIQMIFIKYNIDSSNIKIDKSSLYKFIIMIVTVIFYLFYNYVVTLVYLSQNKRIYVTILYFIEVGILVETAFALTDFKVEYLLHMNMADCFLLGIIVLVAIIMASSINQLGKNAARHIACSSNEKNNISVDKNKKKKSNNNNIEKPKTTLRVILIVFILYVIGFPFVNLFMEYNRNNYRVITEDTEIKNEVYAIQDSKGNRHLVYAIIYEDDKYYYTCILKKNNILNEVSIDANIHKNFLKSDSVTTQYFNDINYFMGDDIEMID